MQVNAEYAQTEASRADNVVQDEIDKFEQMKLTDLKKYLTDFTLINLAFHARAMEMYTYAHQQLLNIDITHDLEVNMRIVDFFLFNNLIIFKEFRTAAPFHRLHPSQRSVSETALNNPKRTTMGGLSAGYSGSMSALPDHRRAEFGSRYSLPADNNAYRGGSLERGDYRKSQPTRGGLHNSSPAHEHSSKHGTTTTSATNKSKTVKPNVAESYSSGSSDSDD
jgi:hypothetical protein